MPNGPGPRQRRATKIANRSQVTPFDRLAQWNAEILRLGAQGAVPSIVGNDLQFKKLSASDISGAMQNPATEDLIMGPWDIIFGVNGNITMDNGSIYGVQTLNGGTSGNLTLDASVSINIGNGSLGSLILNSTQTMVSGTLLELEGAQIAIHAGANNLQMSSDAEIFMDASSIELDASNNIAIEAVGRVDLSGAQIDIDAGATGLQLRSDAKVTIDATGDIEIDATGDIEIDAGGILDLSGTHIYIDAATDITMDANGIDIEATGKLDLSGNNMTINSSNNLEVNAGATLDLSSTNLKLKGTSDVNIIGPIINIGTPTSVVDISGQITLNNVVDLKVTDITATGTIQGGSLTDGVATLTAGALSGATTITSTGQIQGGSLTDGTATMSAGNMTGLVDVSTNSITLKNTKFTSTSETRDLSNAPYVWGVNYLEQIDPADQYLVGSYKQIKSALFLWESTDGSGISYTPPNNVVPPLPGSGIPVLTPPCQGGGELLQLGTPKIWDLPPQNNPPISTYNTFTIPQVVERTMMTIELSIDIWYDSINASRVNTIFFWLGKNKGGNPAIEGGGSGPMAYRMATHMPSYFGTNAMEPTFCHNASITLLGGDTILPYHPNNPRFHFNTGDIFYLTAQCVGSPTFPKYRRLQVKVTWEALN